MNRRHGPPVHDLSSTTGLSLCSSPSTITCSVWSSGRSMVSSFDVLSTILPMSTITFSSALSDDEDEITLDQQPPHSSSSFDGSSAPTSEQHHQQHDHRKTNLDTFALSERSLFEDPTRQIDPTRKFDYAPMAPLRQQQRPQHQQLLGNQKWTAHPSTSSGKSTGDMNMDTKPGLIGQGGRLDVKPRMPTRSFHGDDDKEEHHESKNEEPTKGGPNDHDNNVASRHNLSQSLHVFPPMPGTRRERLVQRLAAVQRIVDPSRTKTTSPTTVACRIAPIFDMNEKSDPPKLPIRTTHDDMTESVLSDNDDDSDSGDGFACDIMDEIIPISKEQRVECGHDNYDLQTTVEMHNQQHEGSVGGSSQEKTKQPNTKPTTKLRSKKTKPSKANTKTSTTSSKKKAVSNKDAESQEPFSTNFSSSRMELPAGRRRSTGSSTKGGRRAAKRSLRPRSKDPPQRFATAPASLSSSTSDSDRTTTFIPKRRVRTRKSLSSERRSRRQFVSNSLASILEDENENTTSPVREEPKAPISCPAAIETSGLEERYDSILDLENRYSSKTRSWAGTASRNLL